MQLVPVVCLVVLVLTGCASTQRVENLEKRVGFLYEAARKRPLSAETCEGYTTPEQRCSLNANGGCRCSFAQDDQDRANLAARAEAIQRKQAEDAAKEAAEPAPEPTPEPHQSQP